MIKLNDILHLTDEEIKRTKLRFMVPNKDLNFDPNNDAKDPEKQQDVNYLYLVHNRPKRLEFKENNIAIGFIEIKEDQWLLTGILRIIADCGYDKPAKAEPLTEKYNFRLVVKFHQNSQQNIRKGEEVIDKLEVLEIWNPDKSLDDNSFPGYKKVKVGFNELKNKIKLSAEWQTALACRKGIYVISDKSTGMLYVGSAYGKDGILGRWRTYVKSGYDKNEVENGKYPNKRLQEIVKKDGMDYLKENFQYSILETFTEDVSDEYIINRESWWKEVLLTRGDFGYNRN